MYYRPSGALATSAAKSSFFLLDAFANHHAGIAGDLDAGFLGGLLRPSGRG
jgi:hypothetical protein